MLAEDPARPEHIIASPAVRTWATACLIGEQIDLEPHAEYALTCENPLSQALKAAQRAYATHDLGTLALVGHNPTLSDMVGWLVYGVGGSGLSLRTGEAALLQLSADGLIAQPGSAELVTCRRMGDQAGIPT